MQGNNAKSLEDTLVYRLEQIDELIEANAWDALNAGTYTVTVEYVGLYYQNNTYLYDFDQKKQHLLCQEFDILGYKMNNIFEIPTI